MFNKKWITLCMASSIIFGASVPRDIAIEVAHNIYNDHEDLHIGGNFLISHIETIKEEENNLLYIFHLEIMIKRLNIWKTPEKRPRWVTIRLFLT